MGTASASTRLATVDDAEVVAHLLHDFNTEFDTPSPGPDVLALRLRTLLAGDDTFAVLATAPEADATDTPSGAVGLALVTLRPNVWYDGRVALLDDLYVVAGRRNAGTGTALVEMMLATCRDRGVDLVEINVDAPDVDAQRFYERHGFSGTDPDTGERAYYYSMDLGATHLDA